MTAATQTQQTGGISRTKERPIIFSAPMVRAILDGRKTQTRRIIKDKDGCCPRPKSTEFLPDPELAGFWRQYGDGTFTSESWRNPYGQPGDRLWVRETWCAAAGEDGMISWNEDDETYKVWYQATDPDVRAVDDDGFTRHRKDGREASPWKSPLHMPRWASRINLEITGIRVERLQEISETGAIAEGALSVRSRDFDMKHFPEWRREFDRAVDANEKPPVGPSPKTTYAAIWDSINGAGQWDKNPWVWVIEFKRMDQ